MEERKRINEEKMDKAREEFEMKMNAAQMEREDAENKLLTQVTDVRKFSS